jgi:HprK-related kinase A
MPDDAVADRGEWLLPERLGRGATIGIGTFSIDLRIEIPEGAREFAELYENYPLQSGRHPADSHIVLKAHRTLAGWLRPKVQVYLEGHAPFVPGPRGHAVPLLESAINWVVFTQKLQDLIIHAATLERGGKAVILPGAPGSGKSTLCADLVFRGWRLLSDEFAIIRGPDAQLHPHPRPVSLKNAAIDLIARRHPAAQLGRRHHGTAKGTVAYLRAPDEAVRRAHELARPCLVVFPRYREGAPPVLERLERARAFMDLIGQSPNYLMLMAAGFETMARLVEACDHYLLTYGSLDDATDMLTRLAREKLGC